MKKIYLAIPYSGMEKSSYEQSTQAAFILMRDNASLNVFSPITHSHALAELGLAGDWEYWQHIDHQFLDWADEIWVLIPFEGIERIITSTGVVAEIKYAKKNSKEVKYFKRIDDVIVEQFLN